MVGLRQLGEASSVWEHSTRHRSTKQTGDWSAELRQSDALARNVQKLENTIENEVIPRLVLARRGHSEAPAGERSGGGVLAAGDVAELGDLVIGRDMGSVHSFVEGVRHRGLAVESMYLDLFAPTARHLGWLWDEDRVDFTEVTLGLSRLEQMLREYSPLFVGDAEHPRARVRQILLAPVPGDQHTFGSHMVADFMRRAGWDVWNGAVDSPRELASIVRRNWYAVVGLSVGSELRVDAVGAAVRTIRKASRNRAIGIMLGGYAINDRPELVQLLGADATAEDAHQAAVQAQNLLALLAIR